MVEEKLRIILVGCGGVSSEWLKAIAGRDDCEIAALVDLRPEAAERRRAQYGLAGALTTTDLDEALRKTKAHVLFNCTTPEAHAQTSIQALRRGCHVLTEKPLADTMASARRMIRAAERAGKLLAVMQNRRYNTAIRRLRAFLQSGAIGPITTVQSNFFIGAHFGGFRKEMEHVLLLDMAIHTFDMARFITGADPINVYCHEWNPQGSWFRQDASAVCVFEMTGGIVYTYQGSWCAEGLNTAWEAEWRVIGVNGSVQWDGADGFRAQVVKGIKGIRSEVADMAVPEFDPGSKIGGHAGLIADFLVCIKGGITPETIATDNIKSLAMVHAAIASASKKRLIPVLV